MSFVYILRNDCLDGWVKIGKTDDVKSRLRSLNSSEALPYSFRCYATYEVDDAEKIEKYIHALIDTIDGSLRAREERERGRKRTREFFQMEPETAYLVFSHIAKLRGDYDKLVVHEPTPEEIEIETKATSRRMQNTTFKSLGIHEGDEITFLYNENIVVNVANDKNQVEYEGNISSISDLALRLLVKEREWSSKSGVNGWNYFTINGVVLKELRGAPEGEEVQIDPEVCSAINTENEAGEVEKNDEK
ncbi:MAG: GIY-YIG nuclease family protein [Verrucomicrobiota bacterium]|nr:GIY-YIG nuclease family protein [Verrucomicrobiota bacterium]